MDILALKGPNLAQLAKTVLRGLEGQTRPFFHTELGPEYEFYTKDWNFECRKSNLAHFGQNWARNWSKMAKNVSKGLEDQKRHFSTQFSALSMNFTLNARILAVEGEI